MTVNCEQQAGTMKWKMSDRPDQLGSFNIGEGAGWRNGQGRPHRHLFVRDWRGSVIKVVEHDGSGTVLEGIAPQEYEAFGSAEGAGPTAGPGYNGAMQVDGFQYLRNRWYDPSTGRFTQEDPIGFAGGINLYAYAGGNPVMYSDPYGLKTDSLRVEGDAQFLAQVNELCAGAGKATCDKLAASDKNFYIVQGSQFCQEGRTAGFGCYSPNGMAFANGTPNHAVPADLAQYVNPEGRVTGGVALINDQQGARPGNPFTPPNNSWSDVVRHEATHLLGVVCSVVVAPCQAQQPAGGGELDRAVLEFIIELPSAGNERRCQSFLVHPELADQYLSLARTAYRPRQVIGRLPVRDSQQVQHHGNEFVFLPFEAGSPADGCIAYAAHIRPGSPAQQPELYVEIFVNAHGRWSYEAFALALGRRRQGILRFELQGIHEL